MKLKLIKLRELVATLKAAWINATKAKQLALDIKNARDEYELRIKDLEAFEIAGKTDEDEVEVAAFKAAVVEVPAGVVDMAEIAEMITKSVSSGLASKLDIVLASQVTAAGIKLIVDQAIKDAKIDSTKVTGAQLDGIVADVMAKQLAALKLPSKQHHAAGDANDGRGGQGVIEVPYGLRKGNLPLHMKQLMNALLRKPQNEGIDAAFLTKGRDLGDDMFMRMMTQGTKALTTSGVATGAEWIPRDLTSELYRRLYLDSQLAQAYLSQEVQMPTDPYDYPLITTDPIFKLNTVENRDAEASDPGTGKFTLTTKKLMALVQYSYESDEDSIIPILPTLQNLLARAAARALENAIINGDTTSTHQDSDVTDVNDQAKAWKGFRKLALAVSALKSDMTSGGINRANLTALLKLLGKWGSRTGDLMWIVGPKAWATLLGLDEFALAYARGGASTFASGAPLQCPFGGQIVLSEMMRENLNAAGVFDNSTTTKGAILIVNKMGFVFGSRREFTVETERNIKSQTNDIVASFRKAFQPVETPAATTAQTVVCGYNYTS